MKSATVDATPGADPDLAVLRAHLDAELDGLPVKLREAVARHYFAGQSHAELARVLGIPEGTAASRVGAGLEKLRSRLAGRGVALGAATLATTLTAEAGPTAPASLLASLPSIATAASAAGAGAGAGTAMALAKGVLKMVFWEKVKLTAAALVCAGAVAGAGVPLVQKAISGEKNVAKPASGLATGSTARVLKGRVVAVLDDKVYVSLGRSHGIKKGARFSCKAKGWSGTVVKFYTLDQSILSVTGGEAEPGDEVQTGYDEALAIINQSNTTKHKPGTPAAARPAQVEGLDLTLRVSTGPNGSSWHYETPDGKCLTGIASIRQVPAGSKYFRHFGEFPELSIRNNGTGLKIISTDLSAGCKVRSFLKDLSGKVLLTSEWSPRKPDKNSLPRVSLLVPGQATTLTVPLHARADVLFKTGNAGFDRHNADKTKRTAERMKKMAEDARKRGLPAPGFMTRGTGRSAYKTLPRGWYLLSVEVDLGAGGTLDGGLKIIGGKVKTGDVLIHLGLRTRFMGIKRGRGVKDKDGNWITR